MMGPVLLTGGMGFVGRQVLRSLLGQGEEVRLVIRKGKQEQLVPSQLVGSTVATPDMFAEDSEWDRHCNSLCMACGARKLLALAQES